MEWIESIQTAIQYIEDNITNELKVEDIAKRSYMSTYYFQKGFAFLCGMSIGEYIRKRKLSLAGKDIISTNEKIIDIAMKYGYDSPDSFTKAFIRFHGVTPTAVRKDGAMIKSFDPLKIKLSIEGGETMNYKIEEKEAFTIVGISKMFNYENSRTEVPKFWQENFYKEQKVRGTYGICIDDGNAQGEFEYIIADNYDPQKEIPSGFVKKVIPKQTWIVFECIGPMPDAIQDLEEKIFSEWLPNNHEYEISANYSIEWYTDISKYKEKSNDPKYYSEIWIPVNKK